MGHHSDDRHHHSRSRDSKDRHDSRHSDYRSSDSSRHVLEHHLINRNGYRHRSRDFAIPAMNPGEDSGNK